MNNSYYDKLFVLNFGKLNESEIPVIKNSNRNGLLSRALVVFYLTLYFILAPLVPVYASDVEGPLASDIVDSVTVESEPTVENIIDETLAEIETGEVEDAGPTDIIVIDSPLEDSGVSQIGLENDAENTSVASASEDYENIVDDVVGTTGDADDEDAFELPSESLDFDDIQNENIGSGSENNYDDNEAAVQSNEIDDVASLSQEVVVDEEADEILPEEVEPQVETEPIATTPHVTAKELVEREGGVVFDKNLCTKVEGGNYLCRDNSMDSTAPSISKVFSNVDNFGLRQVYYTDGTTPILISSSSLENYMPDFDESTMQAVWQSDISGRSQIIHKDLRSGKITQLTGGDLNNSGATVAGKFVAWQSWLSDNWEIFLSDITASPSLPIRLTINSYNDMFPQTDGKTVVWQAFLEGKWMVFVYDIETRTTSTFSSDNYKYENPRFGVFWEARSSDGTYSTVAYDIKAKKEIDLRIPLGGLPELPSLPSRENEIVMPASASFTKTSSASADKEGSSNDTEI